MINEFDPAVREPCRPRRCHDRWAARPALMREPPRSGVSDEQVAAGKPHWIQRPHGGIESMGSRHVGEPADVPVDGGGPLGIECTRRQQRGRGTRARKCDGRTPSFVREWAGTRSVRFHASNRLQMVRQADWAGAYPCVGRSAACGPATR